jgi:hypothetical protein
MLTSEGMLTTITTATTTTTLKPNQYCDFETSYLANKSIISWFRENKNQVKTGEFEINIINIQQKLLV